MYLLLTILIIFFGQIVDEQGQPIGYATVYPVEDPVAGTATAADGSFRFKTDLPIWSEVIISCIGYEKQVLLLGELEHRDDTADYELNMSQAIILREQPVRLNEVVVSATAGKQKNKRKRMQTLLAAVYEQMERDFGTDPIAYRIVSDVRMDSEGEPWGMEQMIARIVMLPQQGHIRKDRRTGKRSKVPTDSLQFAGEYCKRYFDLGKRSLADTILAGDDLEKMNPDYRRAANAIDSGVVIHKTLWGMGNVVFDFANTMGDINHWQISEENEQEIVLTHTEQQNILGIFVYKMERHYILSADDLRISRFAEQAHIELNIPFGYKLKPEEIRVFGLLNMSEKEIEQYRVRKMHADIAMNTFYQERGEQLYTIEKNSVTNATIIGKRKHRKPNGRGTIEEKDTIPLLVRATQRATSVQTAGVTPMTRKEMTNRVAREIVTLQNIQP